VTRSTGNIRSDETTLRRCDGSVRGCESPMVLDPMHIRFDRAA